MYKIILLQNHIIYIFKKNYLKYILNLILETIKTQDNSVIFK